jgi:hypothetical protein
MIEMEIADCKIPEADVKAAALLSFTIIRELSRRPLEAH